MNKALEAYRRLCIHLNYKDDYLLNGSFNEDNDIIENAFEALKIINEKISDIGWFKCCDSLEDYNESVPSYKHLTKNEYEILKKELDNELR